MSRESDKRRAARIKTRFDEARGADIIARRTAVYGGGLEPTRASAGEAIPRAGAIAGGFAVT
jgi:hypothetical protein